MTNEERKATTYWFYGHPEMKDKFDEIERTVVGTIPVGVRKFPAIATLVCTLIRNTLYELFNEIRLGRL